MKWYPAISSLISYQNNYFTWKITVQNMSRNLALHCCAGHQLRQHVADTAAVQCTDLGTEELAQGFWRVMALVLKECIYLRHYTKMWLEPNPIMVTMTLLGSIFVHNSQQESNSELCIAVEKICHGCCRLVLYKGIFQWHMTNLTAAHQKLQKSSMD
jgi:hypothetical protein